MLYDFVGDTANYLKKIASESLTYGSTKSNLSNAELSKELLSDLDGMIDELVQYAKDTAFLNSMLEDCPSPGMLWDGIHTLYEDILGSGELSVELLENIKWLAWHTAWNSINKGYGGSEGYHCDSIHEKSMEYYLERIKTPNVQEKEKPFRCSLPLHAAKIMKEIAMVVSKFVLYPETKQSEESYDEQMKALKGKMYLPGSIFDISVKIFQNEAKSYRDTMSQRGQKVTADSRSTKREIFKKCCTDLAKFDVSLSLTSSIRRMGWLAAFYNEHKTEKDHGDSNIEFEGLMNDCCSLLTMSISDINTSQDIPLPLKKQ